MINLALRGRFFFNSPLILPTIFSSTAYRNQTKEQKMPCHGLFNDMGRVPPGSSLIPQLKALVTNTIMEKHLEVQPKIQPFGSSESIFNFTCTILHIPSPSYLHVHKDCNPAILLKTKCQSNFSSWGSAVMACDKVIQAWHDLRTSHLSWQPWVMLALLLQASPERRARASLGSFQSYTAPIFPCLYPSWSCQYFLLALFANQYLACAQVWTLPCKFTNPQHFSNHKCTSSISAASGIAPHDTLKSFVLSLTLSSFLV